MEHQVDRETFIHETIEATKREMDIYREMRKRRNALALCRPKAELTPEQVMIYQRSTLDPELREVAKTILEEVQYNRNERSMAYRWLIIIMVFAMACLIIIPTVIYFSVRGSSKHYKSHH